MTIDTAYMGLTAGARPDHDHNHSDGPFPAIETVNPRCEYLATIRLSPAKTSKSGLERT